MTDTLLSSASREVAIGPGRPFVVIGERINPSGRRRLAAEMVRGDFARVEADAAAQVDAGAHVLDLNAGVTDGDEVTTASVGNRHFSTRSAALSAVSQRSVAVPVLRVALDAFLHVCGSVGETRGLRRAGVRFVAVNTAHLAGAETGMQVERFAGVALAATGG